MNRLIRLRDGSTLNVFGLVVLAAIAGVIAFIAYEAAPAISMYKHPPTAPSATRDSSASAKKFGDVITWQRAQVNGRSMFYKPLPPTEVAEDKTKPTFYGGPQLLAFVNGTAWFADGQKVSAKEPDGTSVHFVSSRAPWSVRVRWQGAEFDVKLFEKTELSSLSSSTAYGVTWPSASGTPGTPGSRPGSTSGDRSNFPPEARVGPGATQPGAGGDAPPPPPGPPPGAGGGGEPISGVPGAGPAGGSSPTPAPAPSPNPEPASPGGAPSPAPSQPSPQPASPPAEAGGSDVKPHPTNHP